MNLKRIWENVIIGCLCILIPSIGILVVVGLMIGDSLDKKIGIEEAIGDYQEEMTGKYDKVVDLYNKQVGAIDLFNKAQEQITVLQHQMDWVMDKTEIHDCQINQLDLKKWHR